jgi:hypothetical protein
MCDYSLHRVKSRPARVSDRLFLTNFEESVTRGFAAVDEPGVAVCLLPGTEVAFKNDITCDRFFGLLSRSMGSRVARFRQLNMDNPHVHHDALELPDGRIVTLQQLALGQEARVLQLPTRCEPDGAEAAGPAAGSVAHVAEDRTPSAP